MLISVGSVCNFVCIATPTNLEDPNIIEINKESPFTHYIVCQLDKLRIRPETVRHLRYSIEFTVSQQKSEFDWKDYTFRIPRVENGVSKEMFIEGKPVTLNDSLGGSIYYESVFLFLDMFGSSLGWHERIESLLLLDVQYIGKTEITEKYFRFKGHEKILKVSNEIIENRPNKEVLIKLLSFQPPYINGMIIPEIQSDDSRNDWYVGGGLIENMPFDAWKSSVEGALIKYFQPKYNIQYKDNYPSESHTSYKYFYDKNVRSIIVELHEEYMAHKTGNDKVPYTRTRLIQYAMKSDDSGIHIMDNDNQNTDNFLF